MYHLYDSRNGYSQESTLVERTNPVLWNLLRDRVLSRLQNHSYEEDAVRVLEELPLELWKAENGFGDQFSVLYMKLPVEDFVRLARDVESELGANRFLTIAHAFRERGEELRFISMDYIENGGPNVDTPFLKSTSMAVELALENVNTLLQHSKFGAVTGVDRIHTALHAHLIHLCKMRGESPEPSAGLDALFTLLRKHHPMPSVQTDQVLRGLARVINSLSPLRNDSSLAHPNESLLEEPEAMLALNAARTILRYIDRRFSN